MNFSRAATYSVRNPLKVRGYAKIFLLTPIPLFGMAWASGYAMVMLRQMLKGNGDTEFPSANTQPRPYANLGLNRRFELPDWQLLVRGFYATLLAFVCQIAVALICMPLFFLDTGSASPLAPSLIQALASPTDLVVTIIASVVTSVVLTRYALTNSVLAALNPLEIWNHLRAEPSIWIIASLAGFLACNVPAAIVWLLPLHGDANVIATIVASTYFWMFGMMFSIHLMAQAYYWSQRTAAKRAASMGYRW